jgi:aspartyl-tRNA(Asn)/glutamyl-tRNA(Gln) amidotransferase subunit A
MARFDGVHYGVRREGEDLRGLYSNTRSYGLGQEVKRRILFGSYVLTDDRRKYFYHRALQVREDVFQAMKQTLAKYDLVLSPATPTVAFRRNARLAPEEMYRADLCTVYANLSSLPALTVPVCKSEEGLPVTVQFTAGACGEKRLFEIARKLEEYCDEKGI